MRIAIIQPGCFGDNINSTLMLKPLRERFHNATIDVYTTTLYSAAFRNNELINHIYEFPATLKNQALNHVHTIPEKIANKGYNYVLNPHPMINPEKWSSTTRPELGTNLICAWVRCLEDIGVRVPSKLETILRLTEEEKRRASDFFARTSRPQARHVLMEIGHESGQSFWNNDWTVRVGAHLLDSNTVLYLSRKHDGPDVAQLRSKSAGSVHFVGDLSVRECAALYDHCDFFFCVSSGLMNACNTSDRKESTQWYEIVNSTVVNSAPIRTANKTFWYDNNIDEFLSMLKSRGV